MDWDAIALSFSQTADLDADQRWSTWEQTACESDTMGAPQRPTSFGCAIACEETLPYGGEEKHDREERINLDLCTGTVGPLPSDVLDSSSHTRTRHESVVAGRPVASVSRGRRAGRSFPFAPDL